MGFVVDAEALEQDFIQFLRFSLSNHHSTSAPLSSFHHCSQHSRPIRSIIYKFATLSLVSHFTGELIIPRRMRWAERVAHVGEKRNADIIVMEDMAKET